MSASTFSIETYCDDLGPEKVIHLYEPASGLRAIVVVDNTACGPAVGGVRSRDERTEPRRAAIEMAGERVRAAMAFRRPC